MTTLPRRGFTLADSMILVAATAAAFALLRSKGIDLSLPPTGAPLRYVNLVHLVTWASFPFLMTWSLAILILSLLRPRPRLRRLLRQPGVVACGSATLVMVIKLMPLIIFASTIGVERAISKGFLTRADQIVVTYGRNVLFAIEGAWSMLFLSGCWHRGRTWIDRFGTVLGAGWIAGQVVEGSCIVFVPLFL